MSFQAKTGQMYQCGSWRFTFELVFTHQREAWLISCCLLCATKRMLSCRLQSEALTRFILQWRFLHDLHGKPTLVEQGLPPAIIMHWVDPAETAGVSQQSLKELFVLTAEIVFFNSAELRVFPHLTSPCALTTHWHPHTDKRYVSSPRQHTLQSDRWQLKLAVDVLKTRHLYNKVPQSQCVVVLCGSLIQDEQEDSC